MPYTKMNLTFHYKWGNKLANGLRELEGTPKKLGLKAFQ
jgi:hypothetical protein